MTKQEEIREGMARRLFDSEMYRAQLFGAVARDKMWLKEKEIYLQMADSELYELHCQGVVLKVEREPTASICGYCEYLDSCKEEHQECDKFRLEASYVTVESLIEENGDEAKG